MTLQTGDMVDNVSDLKILAIEAAESPSLSLSLLLVILAGPGGDAQGRACFWRGGANPVSGHGFSRADPSQKRIRL
jgi:hypothetical protein